MTIEQTPAQRLADLKEAVRRQRVLDEQDRPARINVHIPLCFAAMIVAQDSAMLRVIDFKFLAEGARIAAAALVDEMFPLGKPQP